MWKQQGIAFASLLFASLLAIGFANGTLTVFEVGLLILSVPAVTAITATIYWTYNIRSGSLKPDFYK